MLYKRPKIVWQDDIKMHRTFRYVSVQNTLSGRRVKFSGCFYKYSNEHSNHIKPVSRASSDLTLRWRYLAKCFGFCELDRDTWISYYRDPNQTHLFLTHLSVKCVCFNCASSFDLAIKHLSPSTVSLKFAIKFCEAEIKKPLKIFIHGLHS